MQKKSIIPTVMPRTCILSGLAMFSHFVRFILACSPQHRAGDTYQGCVHVISAMIFISGDQLRESRCEK